MFRFDVFVIVSISMSQSKPFGSWSFLLCLCSSPKSFSFGSALAAPVAARQTLSLVQPGMEKVHCTTCGHACDADCNCGTCSPPGKCATESLCLGPCNSGGNAKWCGPTSPPTPPPVDTPCPTTCRICVIFKPNCFFQCRPPQSLHLSTHGPPLTIGCSKMETTLCFTVLARHAQSKFSTANPVCNTIQPFPCGLHHRVRTSK